MRGKSLSRQRTFFALALMSLFLSFPALAERMLVTSDLHLTMETALHTPALKALGEAGRDCDVLLFLGDDTNNAHDEEHRYFLNTLEAYKRLTDAEIYVLPGNHDLSGRLGPQEFAKLYHAWGYEGALSRDEASASYAVLTAGGTCLLMMDTNAYTDLGTVAGKGGIGESTMPGLKASFRDFPKARLLWPVATIPCFRRNPGMRPRTAAFWLLSLKKPAFRCTCAGMTMALPLCGGRSCSRSP